MYIHDDKHKKREEVLMPLTYNDLKAYKKKLEEIIEHSQKELNAIKTLLGGMELRQQQSGVNILVRRNQSITQLARGFARNFDGWFTVNHIIDRFVAEGYKTEKDRNTIRPTISHVMGNLYLGDEFKRRNIGHKNKPVFEYQKKAKIESLL